jgi:AcrR family transcriptional regulator
MTLYGYFRGKRELLDAVVDVAAQDFDPPVPSGDFEQDVIAHSLAARRWLMRHPTLVRLRGEEAIVRPSAFRISEGLMRLLLDHGLAPEHAAKAFRLLFTHLFGSVLFSPHDATPEEGRRLTAALLTLPEDEFPAMREAAPHAAGALGGEAQFRFELEVILGGLSR